jgi:hypothetical protein
LQRRRDGEGVARGIEADAPPPLTVANRDAAQVMGWYGGVVSAPVSV